MFYAAQAAIFGLDGMLGPTVVRWLSTPNSAHVICLIFGRRSCPTGRFRLMRTVPLVSTIVFTLGFNLIVGALVMFV